MENNNNNLVMQHLVIGLLLVIITILSTYFIVDTKTKQISEKVVSGMLKIEYDKVGGMDNYVKLNKLSKEQIVDVLKNYDVNGGLAPQAEAAPAPTPVAGGTISADQIEKVTKDGTYILGNPDAEISFVEYSDLECPFCKRLHEAGTIGEVIEAYDGKVNFIFKQFPLGFHPQAQMEAEAALCVGDLYGVDKYYEFIEDVFANSKANGRSYTEDSIADLGADMGVDKTKLLSCISSGDFKQRALDEMAEGRNMFGITGTPGNVLINNKTGDWDKLPGAYPTANFKTKIDALLKK